MAIDTTRMLRGLKRRITVPAAQQLIGDTGFLELGDDVMLEKMVPLLLSTRQDFFVVSTDVDSEDGVNTVDIPARAIGRGLRDIKYSYDGTNTSIRSLILIPIEDEHKFARSGDPKGFYFKGDKVVLVPTPASDEQYTQIWYDLRPGRLVQTSAAAQVTAISVGVINTVVTVSTLPSTIVAGAVVDFVQGVQGNSTLGMDVAVTNVSGTQITFDADDAPTGLVVGDWITIAGQSPVVQLPDDCYPLFETLVCHRILYALGDYDGANALLAAAGGQEKDLKILLEPRIIGEQKKIINRNGLLRGGRSAFWRGGGFF
jgi:hypothetical protein